MAKNLLNSVKLMKPPSSVFDWTHDVKLSCNMGQLVPTFIEEVLPGDRWKLSCESMVRLAPLVAPMMHRVDVYMHYFFVPFRLLWDNWENFITGTKVGGLDPALPFYNVQNHLGSRLNNYLGLPFASTAANDALAFYNSAYQFIYNEYYRDQNLATAMNYKLTDGDNDANTHLFVLQNRAWEHDYFTACLPFAQKGDAVNLPIGALEDVPVYRDAPGGPTSLTGTPDSIDVEYLESDSPLLDPADLALYAATSELDLGSTTIRDFRRALKLQEFLERQAVSGSRYTEFLYGMWGVRAQDSRLQRPEYITGSKSPIQISEVLQTSSTDDESPQGNMAGHGVGFVNGYGGGYSVKEHGCIMGIMSVMPKTAYFQGMPRKFNKLSDRYQFFFNQFEHIGEQEVLEKEIDASSNLPDTVFGYNPRYTEYKVPVNRVAGEFATTLTHWHMARQFTLPPALNAPFIISDPTFRVFAVTDENVDHLYCHILHKAYARRLMSKYSSSHL